MFNDVLNHANLAHWAEYGLVIFFVVFVFISIRTLTISRKQMDRWANLPLADGESGERHE